MKIVTMSKIGYHYPSQANWSYGIWKVDLIDTEQNYCISHTVKENFGGDSRFRKQVEESKQGSLIGYKVIETKGVYPTQKMTGIRNMQEMESKEFINEVIEFITK